MKTVMNIVALVLGVIIGGIVNMLIVSNGSALIPFPDRYDMTSMKSMQATINLLLPKNYIMPWIAHAAGTFTGTLITFNLAKTYKFHLAITVCVFYLMCGIYMVVKIPSPIWFNVLDLGLAYIPMVWVVQRFFNLRKNS